MRRADRLFRLVQLLRRRRVTTARELAEALEVSERTVYRDIADLRAANVPIDGEAGVGFLLPKGFDLPPMTLDADEIEALVLGTALVRNLGDPELAQAAQKLFEKLEAAVPEPMKGGFADRRLFAPQRDHDPAVGQRLRQLRRAVRDKRVVDMTYATSGERVSRRRVRPLALAYWGTTWTLGAWCEKRLDYRTFRIDRIEVVEVLDERFADEPGRTLAGFLAHAGAPAKP